MERFCWLLSRLSNIVPTAAMQAAHRGQASKLHFSLIVDFVFRDWIRRWRLFLNCWRTWRRDARTLLLSVDQKNDSTVSLVKLSLAVHCTVVCFCISLSSARKFGTEPSQRYLLKTILFTNAAKNEMAAVQKETSSSITLKGSTEIVADFFGNNQLYD